MISHLKLGEDKNRGSRGYTPPFGSVSDTSWQNSTSTVLYCLKQTCMRNLIDTSSLFVSTKCLCER